VFAGGAKGPDLAGVKIPTAKCAAAITAVRTADQNPSRFALIMPEFPITIAGSAYVPLDGPPMKNRPVPAKLSRPCPLGWNS